MVNCREAGPGLHSALTGFVNCLLHGEIHPLVSPVLIGGNLIAKENRRYTSNSRWIYSMAHSCQVR